MNPGELLDAYRSDYPMYAREVQKIKTDYTDGKRAKRVGTAIAPFILTRTQRYCDEMLTKYRRLVILKARRKGISTWVEGRIDHRTRLFPNSGAFIVAHDVQTAENLFDKIKIFYVHSPRALRPMVKIFNRDEIHYANPDPNGEPGIESHILNETADNENLGASFDIHFAHFSEVSRFESVGCNVNKMMESLLPAIPDKPNTFVVFESTAEDGGAYFKDKWYASDDWGRVFLSYVSDDTNRADLESTAQYLTDLSDTEISKWGDEVRESEIIRDELKRWFPEITAPQDIAHEVQRCLVWRRKMIEGEACHLDKNVFRRIYPSTPDEAFAGNTISVFNTYVLYEERQILRETPPTVERKRYDFYIRERMPENWWREAFYPALYGPLEVYEESMEGMRYVIGADPSQGMSDGDPAAAIVLRLPDLVEVATWNQSIEPDVFAEVLYALGLQYNKALIGCEVNSIGLVTLKYLQKDLRYANLYQRQRLTAKPSVETTQDQGWHSNRASKDVLITDLRSAVAHREIMLNSMATVEQLLDFRMLPNGELGHSSGKHDDLVMALGMALQMARATHLSMPRMKKQSEYGTIKWWRELSERTAGWSGHMNAPVGRW